MAQKKIITHNYASLELTQKVLASYEQCALRTDTPNLGVFNMKGNHFIDVQCMKVFNIQAPNCPFVAQTQV